MHELGLGLRLETYTFTDGQLIEAVDGLLADPVLAARSAQIGDRIRARQGLRRAADLVERVAREHADRIS
jgi:UDP:flavonoid glycosyltransferase YjiC (YdhE family)